MALKSIWQIEDLESWILQHPENREPFISVHSSSHPRHLWNPRIRWSAASQLETAAWVSMKCHEMSWDIQEVKPDYVRLWLEKWIWSSKCVTSLEEKALFWCLSDHTIFALEATSIFRNICQIHVKYMVNIAKSPQSRVPSCRGEP